LQLIYIVSVLQLADDHRHRGQRGAQFMCRTGRLRARATIRSLRRTLHVPALAVHRGAHGLCHLDHEIATTTALMTKPVHMPLMGIEGVVHILMVVGSGM